jgi:signal transduction histidine kinase
MKVQEQDRMRIAGELHDGVIQQVAALSLMLGTAKRKISTESDVRATVGEVQDRLIQLGSDIREMSHSLHPSALKDDGLPPALQTYCREFSNVRGLLISCDVEDSVRDLSRGAAAALFRIAQEALGNVAKHANAKHVTVQLTRADERVRLSVSDEGSGFDPGRAKSSGGLGLISMRERAHQLNGTLELATEPGHGTTIRVEIPFQ